MIPKYLLTILILGGSLSLTLSYVYGDAFTDLQVSGVSTFQNDLIFDRVDLPNSIVQGSNAFAANRGLVYQVAGGGPMSSYEVRANVITLDGNIVGTGTYRFSNDMIFDRSDTSNTLAQGTNAFSNLQHIIWQKEGGGDMSGFLVRADLITLSGGFVGIGNESPQEQLDVTGNIRLTGNIVSPNDICIGTCP